MCILSSPPPLRPALPAEAPLLWLVLAFLIAVGCAVYAGQRWLLHLAPGPAFLKAARQIGPTLGMWLCALDMAYPWQQAMSAWAQSQQTMLAQKGCSSAELHAISTQAVAVEMALVALGFLCFLLPDLVGLARIVSRHVARRIVIHQVLSGRHQSE